MLANTKKLKKKGGGRGSFSKSTGKASDFRRNGTVEYFHTLTKEIKC